MGGIVLSLDTPPPTLGVVWCMLLVTLISCQHSQYIIITGLSITKSHTICFPIELVLIHFDLREEDNLSIYVVPNVSSIDKFHCGQLGSNHEVLLCHNRGNNIV